MANTAIRAPKPQQNVSAAPATAAPHTTVLDYLSNDGFKQQLAMALPKFFDADRFVRSAISEFRLNPDLQKCSIASVLGYFMQAASCGLEPASVLGQCYPVPFRNKKTGGMECQFILGYRGMAALARRSGEVTSIDAQVVHEKDDFELTYGLEQKLIHKPYLMGDAGAMVGAYCIVRFKDGSYQYRFMPRAEIDAHRLRSKATGFSPWQTDYDEMAKKTVFRALFKWLPITLEAAQMAALDESVARYNPTATGDDMLKIDYVVAEPERDAAALASDPTSNEEGGANA